MVTTTLRNRGQGRRRRLLTAVLALPLTVLTLMAGRSIASPAQHITFAMQAAQANCLPYAEGRVTISSLGPVQKLRSRGNPHKKRHRLSLGR